MKQFEDLKLMPGASVQLVVVGNDQQNYSLDTVYIGSLALHSLLVAMPSPHLEVQWRSGMRLAMTVIMPTGVATLSSRIDAIGERPYSYIHLSYPQEVVFREVRGAARVKVELPAKVAKVDEGDDSSGFQSRVLDISVSGLKLATDTNIGRVGDELTIHITMYFAGIERELSLPAVIRARLANANNEDQTYANVYGVQFLPLPDEQRILLHAFVLNGLQAGSCATV
ncbi:flagellar brake protein [Oceanicoccus sp. KOV_DT_Chl]|uniref:flagellar brake protein n=1 Tax=Oceanicoccus sp. KOV_DT_Chl TaxID=1904639 RepID=UPI000C7C2899|nr:PilZ domain-containing protein [Oceanicoccus sp. KOV_DT_Chl]